MQNGAVAAVEDGTQKRKADVPINKDAKKHESSEERDRRNVYVLLNQHIKARQGQRNEWKARKSCVAKLEAIGSESIEPLTELEALSSQLLTLRSVLESKQAEVRILSHGNGLDAGSSTKVAAVAAPEIGRPSFPKEGDRVEAKFMEGSVVSWSKGTVQKVSSKSAKKTVIVQFDGTSPCQLSGDMSALYRLLIGSKSAPYLLYICSISALYPLYIRSVSALYPLDISA